MEKNQPIYVHIDYGSTGLWVPSKSGEGLGNASYDSYNLPKDLLDRFHIWEGWFTDRRPEDSDENQKMDWKLFDSYGRALAIDLKRFLGKDYHIFYGDVKDCEEIIFVDREFGGGEAVPIVVPKK